MKLVVDSAFSKYVLKGKSLGKRSRLVSRERYNSHNWFELKDSDQLHRYVMDQLKVSGRVKNGKLTMHLAFTAVDAKSSFNSLNELNEFVEGEAIISYDPNESDSPRTKQTGKMLREDSHRLPVQCMDLILRLYAEPDSAIHHGLLQEHADSLANVLRCRIKTEKESVGGDGEYLSATESRDAILPDNKVQVLLRDYTKFKGYANNTPGFAPMKMAYPPLNTTTNAPPAYLAWAREKKAHNMMNPSSSNALLSTGGGMSSFPPFMSFAHNMVTADANTSGDVTVTFKYASEELSITINGDLTLGSSMMDVMKAGDDVEESFGLASFDQVHLGRASPYVFKVNQKTNGKVFSFRKTFFSKSVESVLALANVEKPLFVTIEDTE